MSSVHLKTRIGRMATGLAVMVMALAAACGGEPSIPTVAVESADFSFSSPATVPAGFTRFELTNVGQDPHHMQLLRLNDGVTQQQFQGALQEALLASLTEGEAALLRIFQITSEAGGPGGIVPGGNVRAVVDLQHGQYVLTCFLSGADGIPHIAKGMVKALEVTAPPDEQPSEPDADVTVDLNDFAFVGAPATLSAGVTTFKVVNQGQEPHEMSLIRLNEGVSFAQLREAVMTPPELAPPGPPPATDSGGYQAITPGASGWVTVNLAQGEYALVCFVPSPANGFVPHVALGMISSLTVQ